MPIIHLDNCKEENLRGGENWIFEAKRDK